MNLEYGREYCITRSEPGEPGVPTLTGECNTIFDKGATYAKNQFTTSDAQLPNPIMTIVHGACDLQSWNWT